MLLALGGGSAIDAAKAIAGLATNGGQTVDYMEVVGAGRKITQPALPWMAIPTTAGTGAEATRNAVISHVEKQYKASLRSPHLLPRMALVDAELGLHVRPEITARAGLDALTQLIEAYTSQGANPLTDALALRGIECVARSLRQAYAHGDDLDAREEMALAALLSGICLNNAGLGAVHGFASPLGARFPVPHGVVCGVLLPHVLVANLAELERTRPAGAVWEKYKAVAGIVNPGSAPQACVAWTKDLVAEFKLPGLAHYGLTEKDIPELVAAAQKSNSMRYNPVALSGEVLAGILRAAR
jgi:alcohol dehydrogenase class IV